MPTVKLYNQKGEELSDLELNKDIFGLPWNADLVSQVVRVAMANKRQVLSSTKTREEVSGGGRKPWRQKGTGRARHGSIRSPLWKGGGVTFGPTKERNFKLKINKKMADKAFLTALSGKVKDNELLILDALEISTPKTKEMAKIMASFPKVKSGLLILLSRAENIKRATRNLSGLSVMGVDNINILDILQRKYLIFTKDCLECLNKKYGR
ncbi:MAG: 50S ribosomal protein L4 [Candidatus Azambacteria bacterium]|nr:50S ribosomal protein L4 [Candidatus Azambacteria bacterium]